MESSLVRFISKIGIYVVFQSFSYLFRFQAKYLWGYFVKVIWNFISFSYHSFWITLR